MNYQQSKQSHPNTIQTLEQAEKRTWCEHAGKCSSQGESRRKWETETQQTLRQGEEEALSEWSLEHIVYCGHGHGQLKDPNATASWQMTIICLGEARRDGRALPPGLTVNVGSVYRKCFVLPHTQMFIALKMAPLQRYHLSRLSNPVSLSQLCTINPASLFSFMQEPHYPVLLYIMNT